MRETETSIFTKIIRREIPAEIIYEDEKCIVIPDKFPSMEGQVLVIPKEQLPYLFASPDDLYEHLTRVTKKVAHALDTAFSVPRTCMVVEGFEVPHIHIRLYPCPKDQLILSPRKEAPDEELKRIADKIRAALR